MMPSLLSQYGSWRGVCEHCARRVKKLHRGTRFDESDFIEWMMLQEKYSTYDELFGDMVLYLYCYLVYKKLRSGEDQHHITLISGKIGKGKSILGAIIAALTDPTFCRARECYIPSQFFGHLRDCKPTQAVVIDEGGRFFKASNKMTQLGKDLGTAMQEVRALQQHLIICYDQPEWIAGDVVDKFDNIFVKMPEEDEVGDRKYRRYLWFNTRASLRVMPLLKKREPITSPKILRLCSADGRNSGVVPTINDFGMETYKADKERYVRDKMGELMQKYASDEVNSETSQILEIAKGIKTVQLSKVPDQYGVSAFQLDRARKRGLLHAFKQGNLWKVTEDELLRYLNLSSAIKLVKTTDNSATVVYTGSTGSTSTPLPPGAVANSSHVVSSTINEDGGVDNGTE